MRPGPGPSCAWTGARLRGRRPPRRVGAVPDAAGAGPGSPAGARRWHGADRAAAAYRPRARGRGGGRARRSHRPGPRGGSCRRLRSCAARTWRRGRRGHCGRRDLLERHSRSCRRSARGAPDGCRPACRGAHAALRRRGAARSWLGVRLARPGPAPAWAAGARGPCRAAGCGVRRRAWPRRWPRACSSVSGWPWWLSSKNEVNGRAERAHPARAC